MENMETKKQQQLEAFGEVLLETLSFLEPMSLSQILFDIDEKKIMSFTEIEQDDFFDVLKKLEQQKKIKKIKHQGESAWVRVLNRKPWWKRIFL